MSKTLNRLYILDRLNKKMGKEEEKNIKCNGKRSKRHQSIQSNLNRL